MKIKHVLLLSFVAFSSIGCESLKRLPGLESPKSTTNTDAPNPNDFYVTGTTVKDHQSVYLTISSRTITVAVMQAGQWTILQRPDITDYLDSYQLFTIPQEGVYFGDLAYKDASGSVHFTRNPSAPTGTQYRIHSVAKP